MRIKKYNLQVFVALMLSGLFLTQCSNMGFLGELVHSPVVKNVTLVVIVQDQESEQPISDQQIPVSIQCDGTNFSYKEQVYSGATRNGQAVFKNPPNRGFVVNAFETQKYNRAKLEVERGDLPASGPYTVTLKLKRLVTVLEGRVYNEVNNYPVKNASVMISDARNNATTDTEGNFSLRVPNYNPQIKYSLSISHSDYSPYENTIPNIRINEKNFLGTFSLKPLGDIEILEIKDQETVTGNQRTIPR